MSKTYRPWNPDQQWLLPPSPREWLPEGDLVYFVMDVVRQMDITAITRAYEQSGRGYPPFHPRMMVCLLIYSYAMGVRSSRQIAQHCQRDVAWRVIVGDDAPDFRTISLFRKTHLDAFAELFVQVLQIAREAGLVKLGHVALDGTKVKANASRHKAMSYGRMKQEEARLRQEIGDLLAQAESVDAHEDAAHGKDRRGDELPRELLRREQRLKRIEAARKALEDRQKQKDQDDSQGGDSGGGTPEVPENAQYNFTDPESRIMKANNRGWDQCGNAQAVVDAEAQIIVAADVTNASVDVQQVEPMVEQAIGNTGEVPTRISMDAGYFSEKNMTHLAGQQIDAYIATGRLKHGDVMPASPRGRIPEGYTPKQRMARKLRTKSGRATYARRKAIVEPVFGQLKRVMGFGQFLLRGLKQMRGEWRLACLSYNMRRLFHRSLAAA